MMVADSALARPEYIVDSLEFSSSVSRNKPTVPGFRAWRQAQTRGIVHRGSLCPPLPCAVFGPTKTNAFPTVPSSSFHKRHFNAPLRTAVLNFWLEIDGWTQHNLPSKRAGALDHVAVFNFIRLGGPLSRPAPYFPGKSTNDILIIR